MIESIISAVSGLVSLGAQLYARRGEQHAEILAHWQALQVSAAALESSLKEKRVARDAASLAALDALEKAHG